MRLFTCEHAEDKDDKITRHAGQTHNALDFYFILWQFKRIFSLSHVCVCVWLKGLQKQNKNSRMNWASGIGFGIVVQTEKLQVALFSTKLFTEESDDFFL